MGSGARSQPVMKTRWSCDADDRGEMKLYNILGILLSALLLWLLWLVLNGTRLADWIVAAGLMAVGFLVITAVGNTMTKYDD